jgi:hypothetical protein
MGIVIAGFRSLHKPGNCALEHFKQSELQQRVAMLVAEPTNPVSAPPPGHRSCAAAAR